MSSLSHTQTSLRADLLCACAGSRSGKVTAESESSSADESGDSAPTKRHKKRAKFKTKPQRKKGLKGKLEIFGMLPLELLGEVSFRL